MSSLTLALTAFELRAERTVADYLEHTDTLTAQAAVQGAGVIVFPELASTGLLASAPGMVTSAAISRAYWEHLTSLTDEIVAGHAEQARRHGITVLAGSHNHLASDGTLRNTAFLVHPDGSVETQDKIHLTPQEHQLGTTGGDSLLVTKVGPFTAAILICADVQFPELARHLVERGVELIFCPSLTWNRRGIHRVRTGALARAMENQLYVAMSPLVGSSGLPTDAPMHAVGTPFVAAPVDKTFGYNDGILAAGDLSTDGLLLATVDRQQLLASRARPEVPGLALRRPELYGRLAASVDGPRS
ncbi:nitrilase-related carbon-nitrogen hydrolase [Streptomyces sp. NPDC005708]|uniref:nitrilase-related carbon-nitrogen hydrolase n=1 Tax=Streptomyces sp. NPDC005708 TaxID=3154564 RepID=UPI0033C5E1E7